MILNCESDFSRIRRVPVEYVLEIDCMRQNQRGAGASALGHRSPARIRRAGRARRWAMGHRGFEPTRARVHAHARAELRADRSTNRRRGRVARLELDVYIVHSAQGHIPVHNEL